MSEALQGKLMTLSHVADALMPEVRAVYYSREEFVQNLVFKVAAFSWLYRPMRREEQLQVCKLVAARFETIGAEQLKAVEAE